jgi:hypothetical protein
VIKLGGIKLRKMLKRLEARQKAYDGHGKNPNANPGKQEASRMTLHRPGSNTK